MSSVEFHGIGARGTIGRSERLFRAAIAAFCALTRPTRREIAQLDDLCLPLFGSLSTVTLRYAAAALSEARHAPPGLTRRLANEPVEISAPLLLNARALSDIDLITLIGRHGLPHARVIAQREGLHPRIATLIEAIDAGTTPAAQLERSTPLHTSPIAAPAAEPSSDALEQTRSRLRAMMLPAVAAPGLEATPKLELWPEPPTPYGKLLSTALSGIDALYETALADLLEIDMPQARSIVASSGPGALPVALKALELSEERAFLIVSCIHPGAFADRASIVAFLDRYRALSGDQARRAMRDLQSRSLLRDMRANDDLPAAPAPQAAGRHSAPVLRAS